MKKEQLRKLRALNATPAMMKEGIKEGRDQWGYKSNKYYAVIRLQQLGAIIKMAVFEPEWMKKDIKTPRYEVFINIAGGEWITRELDEEGKEIAWKTSMVRNLLEYRYGRKAYLNQDAKKTLNRTFKDFPGDPIRKLERWQQSIRDAERARQEEKETAPWDADMKLVPKLPKSFESFMTKECCKDFYIFYDYKRSGATEGLCSRCGHNVKIKEPKHGKETKCPRCGAKATFKSKRKIQTLSTEYYFGQIIQKIEGGLVVRDFEGRQYHFDGNGKRNAFLYERERTLLFDDGTIKDYEYGMYKNKYMRWKERGMHYSYWGTSGKLYKRNWSQIEQSDIFKRSAIGLWPELPVSVPRYLAFEKEKPVIEKLAKVGLFKLAEGFFRFRTDADEITNSKETELAKMLKIDGSRLKRLIQMDGDEKHLKWFQYEKTADRILPDEVIDSMAKAGLIPSNFFCFKTPVSMVKAYNYLVKQSQLIGESLYDTFISWRDYYYMAEQMKMDVSNPYISRPKDLTAAHNELVLIKSAGSIKQKAKELRKKWPKAEAHLKNLEKFEYQKGDFRIIAPKSLDDIVKEGIVLRHCVHTCDYYFDRIQRDESYLFFLRKEAYPDMPWYTLEVEPSGNIRQKRTTGDSQNADFEAALGFLKGWQKYFKKQMTKKEKKLGEKADILRKQNYSDLRKNQNRIWHGKLAGQLLADVLEADLMLAE